MESPVTNGSPRESPQELRALEEEEGEESEENNCSGGLLDEEVRDEYICQICDDVFKQPRLLNCLHRFCTACVEKQVRYWIDLLAKLQNLYI